LSRHGLSYVDKSSRQSAPIAIYVDKGDEKALKSCRNQIYQQLKHVFKKSLRIVENLSRANHPAQGAQAIKHVPCSNEVCKIKEKQPR